MSKSHTKDMEVDCFLDDSIDDDLPNLLHDNSNHSLKSMTNWTNSELRGLLEGLNQLADTNDAAKLADSVQTFGKSGPAGGRKYKAKTPEEVRALIAELNATNTVEPMEKVVEKPKSSSPRRLVGERGEVFRGQTNLLAWKSFSAAILLQAGEEVDQSKHLRDALEALGKEVSLATEQVPKMKRHGRGKAHHVDIGKIVGYLGSFVKSGAERPVLPCLESAVLDYAMEAALAELDSPPLNTNMVAGETELRRMAAMLSNGQSLEIDNEALLALNPLGLSKQLLNPPYLP